MSEKPIERLNYFNGQRLQAGDFRLEQDYHIRVRRWLNRSLYEPGIAMGLEVHAVPGAPRVRVSPGLAIDAYGREIILLEETEVPITHDVQDKVNNTTATYAMGPYLVIRYNEQTTSQQDGGCAPDSTSSDKTAAGGPSRILAEPVFECVPYPPPDETSNKIVLGLVILAKGCGQVDRIDTSIRRYVGEASAAKVKQYALEGEREVAAIPTSNPAQPLLVKETVRFHVRGRQPNSVTLYLKAREISRLHYTELGWHQHSLSVSGGTGDPTPALNAVSTRHNHNAGADAAIHLVAANNSSGIDSAHNHTLMARKGYIGKGPQNQGLAAFFLIERDWGVQFGLPTNLPAGESDVLNTIGNALGDLFRLLPVLAPEIDAIVEDILDDVNGTIGGGIHSHKVVGDTEYTERLLDLTHQHSISGTGTSGAAGAEDHSPPTLVARTGKPPLSYVNDLRIAIDGTDRTQAITVQILNLVADAAAWKNVLGDGSSSHPLADEKTDAIPIRLDFIPGVVLGEGEHLIEFSVGLVGTDANGGRVHYNLYVE